MEGKKRVSSSHIIYWALKLMKNLDMLNPSPLLFPQHSYAFQCECVRDQDYFDGKEVLGKDTCNFPIEQSKMGHLEIK